MMQKYKTFRSELQPNDGFGDSGPVEVYLADDVEHLEKDAARYRWLRDGNAYKPEGQCINGGEELDELCDNGLMDSVTK